MEEKDPQLSRHPTWHRPLLVLPAAHHRRSIPVRETSVRGSTCPTQLLYETPFLYLGLNKPLASALPTRLQFWTFPPKGSVETQVPHRLFRMNQRATVTVWGLTCLSTSVLPGCKGLKFSVQFVRTFALRHPMLYLGSLFLNALCPRSPILSDSGIFGEILK